MALGGSTRFKAGAALVWQVLACQSLSVQQPREPAKAQAPLLAQDVTPVRRPFAKLFEMAANEGACQAYVGNDQATAVTRKANGSIRLYEVNGSRLIADLGEGEQVAIGKLGVAVREGRQLRFFDTAGTLVNEIEHELGLVGRADGSQLGGTPFSDDGQRLLTADGQDCAVLSVPALTQLWRGKCRISAHFANPTGTRLVTHPSALVDLDNDTRVSLPSVEAISSEAALLLAYGRGADGKLSIQIFDSNSGKPLSTLQSVEPELNGLRSAIFSADHSTVLARAYNGTLRIWDVASGRHLRDGGQRGAYGAVALSANGKRFADGHAAGGAWDVDSATQRLSIPEESFNLSFDASGDRLIVEQPPHLHGYDLRNRERLFEIKFDADELLLLPNGKQLVSSHKDCQLVDISSGAVAGRVGGQRFTCESGQFLADGRFLCLGAGLYAAKSNAHATSS